MECSAVLFACCAANLFLDAYLEGKVTPDVVRLDKAEDEVIDIGLQSEPMLERAEQLWDLGDRLERLAKAGE